MGYKRTLKVADLEERLQDAISAFQNHEFKSIRAAANGVRHLRSNHVSSYVWRTFTRPSHRTEPNPFKRGRKDARAMDLAIHMRRIAYHAGVVPRDG